LSFKTVRKRRESLGLTDPKPDLGDSNGPWQANPRISGADKGPRSGASIAQGRLALERVKFPLRLDWQNALKTPGYGNPASVFNSTNNDQFGTFSGGRGSFSDIGTHRSHGIMVLRVEG
jgi:hypothetical protein